MSEHDESRRAFLVGTAVGAAVAGTALVPDALAQTPHQPAPGLATVSALDGYEEGTWTPVVTCEMPGDLSYRYVTSERGRYTKIGRLVQLEMDIILADFNWSKASGQVIIPGMPFPAGPAETNAAISFHGITKENYTAFIMATTSGTTALDIEACAQGQGIKILNIDDLPSGGTKVIRCTHIYST